MTGTLAIRMATEADINPVSAMLTDAFATGPVAEWLIGDESTRREVYATYARMMFGYTLTHGGQIQITADRSGAAVWYPMLGTPTDPGDYPERLAAATGAHVHRFGLLDQALEERRPATAAHHYLAFIGVAPARQCTGIGSALLTSHHAYLETVGMPAYLVATSTGSRDLYLRHGYTVTDTFTLPDGPPLWQMWRNPDQRPAPSTPHRRTGNEATAGGKPVNGRHVSVSPA